MQKSTHIYYHDDTQLQGFVAYKDFDDNALPGILLIHDWSGCNELIQDKAISFAEKGYVALAVDMYGKGHIGQTTEEKQKLIQPFLNDRLYLQQRILAGLETLAALEFVDATKIAAIGFCFGGLCALDIARSGADIKAAISVHGLLNKPENLTHEKKINAKILALHGYDDPMVPPNAVIEFCQEMTDKNVDWQFHIYGNTQHAFTNPLANDQKLGTVFNQLAAKRAFELIDSFLQENLNS